MTQILFVSLLSIPLFGEGMSDRVERFEQEMKAVLQRLQLEWLGQNLRIEDRLYLIQHRG